MGRSRLSSLRYQLDPAPRAATHRHLHLNLAHGLVPLHNEIFHLETVNPRNLLPRPTPLQRREVPRLPLQLYPQRLDVIGIDMRISHLEDELVWLGIGDEGDHVSEERVRRDIEWDAEAEVA